MMADCHVLIPAAGGGTRMGADRPKQYLDLLGAPLIAHTLRIFQRHPAIRSIWVVLSPDDAHWEGYDWQGFDRLQVVRCGGATRADSVRNGLAAMAAAVDAEDWVLVHDAARPCLDRESLDRLIATVGEHPVGGILAVPVADTLKRAGEGGLIRATVAREGLWAAQTPQMYRHRLLLDVLTANQGVPLTDEAQAIETWDLRQLLVPGKTTNFKVTYPEDLALARLILAGQNGEGA